MSDKTNEARFAVDLLSGDSVSAVVTAADGSPRAGDDLIILAHGAGNDMDSPFMQAVAERLVGPGRAVLRFNFPYMEAARRDGRRKPPNRADKLEATWTSVADHVREKYQPGRLFLGGKSMGGRMASHLAAGGYRCDGLVFLGYPLHPPGKPDKLRKEHLARIECPMLFIQGSRDSLCKLDQLEPILAELPVATTLHRVEGGDHSFKVLKRLGRGEDEVMDEVCKAVTDWTGTLAAR